MESIKMKSIYRGLIKSKEKTDRMKGWVGE